MIEIQCTSCHTRYRIDERVLPDETPTFKCSRCGHVFNASPAPTRPRKPAPQRAEKPKVEEQPQPEIEQAASEAPPVSQPQPSPAEPRPARRAVKSDAAPRQPENPPEQDNPLDRSFARDRDESPDAGANQSFDFRDEPRIERPRCGSEQERKHAPTTIGKLATFPTMIPFAAVPHPLALSMDHLKPRLPRRAMASNRRSRRGHRRASRPPGVPQSTRPMTSAPKLGRVG